LGGKNEKSSMTAAGTALRLMVVDDNVDAAHTLAMFLEAEGHEVVVEYQAENALVRARDKAPNVCLLDIGLPDVDGNELARRLRSMPQTARSVLIAVTGYGQVQDRKKAFAAGFDYHFVKPVDTSKLASLLAEISVR
jgi:CheY-like chemotaxis protein